MAHHLSCAFGLPIFSNDNIRYEVREDLRARDINEPAALEEYNRRVIERRDYFLGLNQSLIIDGSVDRHWRPLCQDLDSFGYDIFLINMELSRRFLVDLYTDTGRIEAINELDAYLEQHQKFLQQYSDRVNVSITDETFPKRLQVASQALSAWLTKRV